jgi:hypothetical protein
VAEMDVSCAVEAAGVGEQLMHLSYTGESCECTPSAITMVACQELPAASLHAAHVHQPSKTLSQYASWMASSSANHTTMLKPIRQPSHCNHSANSPCPA